ncbi:MAG: hypothetical protein E5W70_18095 [Mesorhizobium sp.]|uniref:hypothetical protein n=1 Tax=Mesorhizobium sp. TaxID=1871066 RepID=UPI0011FF49DF|nr:hypothetical protein [Mesorhizobium sp.]TIT21143.1 MAG: hypothetical protein E5W70_18095 [Mesorhizobium sp.]
MNGTNTNSDEKRFNETLRRMLKTPPKPHENGQSDKPHSSKVPHKKKLHGPSAKKDHTEKE